MKIRYLIFYIISKVVTQYDNFKNWIHWDDERRQMEVDSIEKYYEDNNS